MNSRKHSHYFKDVRHLSELDVYRVLALFGVTDQALGHAIKKLLVAGGRGAGKDITRDVAEAVDTLQRWQEMREEDLEQPVTVTYHDPGPDGNAARLLAHLENGCPCCGPSAPPGGPVAGLAPAAQG